MDIVLHPSWRFAIRSQKLSSNRNQLHKLELNDFHQKEVSISSPSPFTPDLNDPVGLLSGFFVECF